MHFIRMVYNCIYSVFNFTNIRFVMKKLDILNNYFTKNNDKLVEISINILKKRHGNNNLATTLVTECYMYMHDNLEKIKFNEKTIESMVVNWMNKQIEWNNTIFKKKFIYKNFKEISINKKINTKNDMTIEDTLSEIDEDEIDINQMLRNDKKFQQKLEHIFNFVETLPLDKQLLFRDVYINNINTSGKLAKHCGLSRTTCYFLIKNLKEIIKNNYNN